MYLNKKESGIAAWAIVVVIAIALVGGGIALYQSERNSAYDEISFEGLPSVEEQEDQSLGETVTNDCVTNINIQPGQTVSFPLQVTGDLGYRCWGIFEGEAGNTFVRQNGQVISQTGTGQGLMQMMGEYYQESDYPVGWSATISGLIAGVSGPAELVIRERGDLGEEPGQYVPQEIIIPINIVVGSGSSQQGNTSGTVTLMVPVINGEGGIQNANNAGIELSEVPQSWRDQGLYLGCGDAVAYLPVEVPYTQAVLNATYEYLFAASPTITYQGQTYTNLIGSYAQNTNYPMNFDSVEINGTTARIYLTGTIMNNHCADPAIMAQIEFAATQYPTVDDIEIYLNGQPFDVTAWYNSYAG